MSLKYRVWTYHYHQHGLATPPPASPWRLLVCGDRNWRDYDMMEEVLVQLHRNDTIECIIHGDCMGADVNADRVGRRHQIPIMSFPANWKKYGAASGPIRNTRMLEIGMPNRVIAFHDSIETSKGTADMLRQAKKANIWCQIYSHATVRT